MPEFTPLSQATVVNVADNSTTVSTIPAVLTGIYVNTTIATASCPITDAAVAKVTLPVSLAAGTMLKFPDVKFATSLIVDPGDTATGNITVFWRGL